MLVRRADSERIVNGAVKGKPLTSFKVALLPPSVSDPSFLFP
jgi:hypothetical protein